MTANKEKTMTIWARLGAFITLTEEEANKILSTGDTDTLIRIIREGRFELGGDSYIPDVAIEDLNDEHGTSYPEQDVYFDL